ncbi:Crp/Fnr family transcriptional regulator [Paraburkholderia xenovorans]|uniref:Crp/Fnr family transcriptional regulator n=1 Tax=Paraburkholderia xenovorans TaxID=36873 RepID=UPI0038BD5B8A
MNKIIELKASLAQQTLFAASDGKTIELLANAARVVDFKSGAYVTLQGEVESPLLLILSGQLRVSRLSAKGDETPIRTVSAGGSTGAVPIISNRPSNVNVIANRESTVAMIGRTLARQVLCEPLVSVALNGLLASLVERLVHCHSRREFPRAAARVAAVIVDELDLAADLDAAPAEPPSHATIAAMAKVSRETVSRVLSSLELRGLIAREGRRIRVLDPDALRALANG